MPMAAFTTDFDPEPYSRTEVGARDWKGDPVAGADHEGLITTSLGGAYDRERMIRQYELHELESSRSASAPQGLPKTERVNEDRACMQAADEALSAMQAEINKVPQPTWVSNNQKFAIAMEGLFNASAESYGVPQGKMNKAMDVYGFWPKTKDDVAGKVQAVQNQIQQMDGLVQSIDKKFSILEEVAISKDDKMALSSMLGLGSGVTHNTMSIDAIYAVDPGRFEPKDGEGRPTKYDPRNLIHVLQAVEHLLENPARGLAEGMSLYGPNAIAKLRETLSDRTLAAPEYNPGVSNSMINQINQLGGPGAAPPRRLDDPNNDDPNNPNSPTNRRNRMDLGLLGRF